MAYATQDDLKPWIEPAHLTVLTDDDEDGQADAPVIAGILTDASAQVDAALVQAGYTVPVAAPGDYLQSLTVRLSLAALYGRRPTEKPSEYIQKAIEAAREELVAIREGNLTPPELIVGGTDSNGVSVESEADRGWADAELF